jgi:multisubunit Na+/H+ antiporter MnhB subunit
MSEAFSVGLALVVIALAVWTVAARDTFAAVVGFVAYGMLLTLVWVRLRAFDVALTEGALGSALTGAMLIRAAGQLRRSEAAADAERPAAPIRVVAALAAGCVTAALAVVVLALPEPAPTLAPEVADHIGTIGVGNPITAVLMAFRATDTLLEAIVVLFALVGVWSLAPDRVWGGRPGPQYRADPDGVLAYFARTLPPIGLVVGIYIFWIGADLPGGKFQGSTILAAMWLLAMKAGLVDAPPVSRRSLRLALVMGPVAFIAIGIAGAFSSGAFLAYPDGLAKPLIKVVEWALLPSLTLTLALIVAGTPERSPG